VKPLAQDLRSILHGSGEIAASQVDDDRGKRRVLDLLRGEYFRP
jgi:hypothetical protein